LEYRRLLPKLPAAHPVWAVDLFGFGFTERRPDWDYHPGAIKTHLYHFWQTHIQQPMILVAASMGGAAAIDFALTYPDLVAQLVLIDSAGIPDRPWTWRLMFWPLDAWATEFLRSAQVRDRISRSAYFDERYVTPDANCCASLHVTMPHWDRALMKFTKSGGYGTFLPQLPHLQAPTLILWGERDRILGTKDAAILAQHIPQSELVWIAQAGHVPHLEQSQAVADAIAQFISQHQPLAVR
jgi:pimeloyl-ACP methyl ester carboxylesterase